MNSITFTFCSRIKKFALANETKFEIIDNL